MITDNIDFNIIKKMNEDGAKAYPRYCCQVCKSPYGNLYLKMYYDYNSYTLGELQSLIQSKFYREQEQEFRDYIEELFFHKLSYTRPDIYKLYKELQNNLKI